MGKPLRNVTPRALLALTRLSALCAIALALGVTGVRAGTDVRVATWNISQVGAPFSPEYDASLAILNRIGADIVAVNGVDDMANLNSLAADAGYAHVGVGTVGSFGPLRNAFLSIYPIVEGAVHTSVSLSGDPAANDITHHFVSIKVEFPPPTDRDLVLIVQHWKSGTADSDEFRRAIDSRRISQALNAVSIDGDAVVVMGDVEEEITGVPRTPNPFTSEPAGLPGGWKLGSDLVPELSGGGIANDPFSILETDVSYAMNAVAALQLDGSEATRPASGRRLDYVFINPFIDRALGEVYDSLDEGLPGGLPKFGLPPSPGTSADASDHFPVFIDITIPSLPRAEPAVPATDVRVEEPGVTVRWEAVDDFFDSGGHDLHYELERDDTPPITFGDGFRASSDSNPSFTSIQDPQAPAPFDKDHQIAFTLPPQPSGSTFWWRVRARESGADLFGPWSEPRSVTIDTTEAPTFPLADWYQTTGDQFLTNQLDNALVVGDEIIIADEFMFLGTVRTPLITLSELQASPSAMFHTWKQATVRVTHPDPITTVEVAVFDEFDVLLSSSGLHSGIGVHDVTADLTGLTNNSIYLLIQMTAGSTPSIHSILVKGDENGPVTGIQDSPPPFSLEQNFPNPFNPSTSIAFAISERAGVHLAIYDVTGRHVATLLDERRGPGRWLVDWDGKSKSGNPVASGVYYYRLRLGDQSVTRKMVVIR